MVTAPKTTASVCRRDDIVKYLDAELMPDRELAFEAHLSECANCRAELNREKQILLALDRSFEDSGAPDLPEDFARRISVAAVSDIGQIRQPRERILAAGICVLLLLFAFAALGGATDGLRIATDRSYALVSVVGHFFYHAAYGFTAMFRPLVSYVGSATLFWVTAFAVFAGAMALMASRFARRGGRP